MNAIEHRYDFVLYFDVQDGNPNGDPDAGNMPRIDPETGQGIVTDVCIKRKVRDYVSAARAGQVGYGIYISPDATLNSKDRAALSQVAGVAVTDQEQAESIIKKMKNDNPKLDETIRDFMCANYFDVRTFGAVMTTFTSNNLNCGQVRGPVQLTFARSVDPIAPQSVGLIRRAVTTDKDAEDKINTMGNKSVVPYGLYRCHGFVSANLAQHVTGFNGEDMDLLIEAFQNMFELDRAAARGLMSTRSLIVFEHDSTLGNAPAHVLFDAVKCDRKPGVDVARSFDDYIGVEVDESALPAGVTVHRIV